ncbi:DUF2076 domain-containing protein [Erwinia tracheiphila]|uniref:ABC transporter substrate-binding protein n=1 Tax=Erwinia tracheiphila TaxID=65700 RepID=A0A0M2KAL9_9GAMM|nr:DUF2076 domain-containing protein [Erwinia tracheiphila]EOS93012.1 hypothetical protein ETR_21422 [Erwinia tracheiphila PSU-1]KKF36425.1 ABC transporter substrate-binding protein [Erwinia tracheiphila]UIA87754.1 DUF2076 domain-containing protein [Erwinia tracheiphila]UIA96119.1 DUF2076 domain-containing protein [Erwinia tracheiphila]
MQNEEQQLIENLFNRLKQAETQSAPRDATAEKLIQQHIQQQPGAPYYMAQAILIQEAAMKQLNNRVSELEAKLAQSQQPPQQSSGGFLSGLFGGGQRQSAPQSVAPQQSSPWGNNAPVQQQPGWSAPPAAAPSATRGFLGGALQTAVGVAGGVVMADMLTSMFHHSQPEEIVNIINEPALPQESFDNNLDTFNDVGGNPFSSQDAGFQRNDSNDFAGFGSDDFDSDNFGDDDSFV